MEMDKELIKTFLMDNFIISQSVLVREYEFNIKGLEDFEKIKVKIYHDVYRKEFPFRFELSHYPKTPMQTGTYIPTTPFEESEEAALLRAISSLTE